jgi:DNA-binding response OmpR family regulator
MRILIIEDSDAIRNMIQALVSGRGHEVEAVSSGPKGLEAALANPPDAILLDLNLPGLHGFEVCERLRANVMTRSTPILIISATADDDAKDRALKAGASAYYTKPFSPMALLKEIEQLRTRTVSRP